MRTLLTIFFSVTALWGTAQLQFYYNGIDFTGGSSAIQSQLSSLN